MDFFKLLCRFIPLYKWRILAYVVLNIVCSICNVFSFIAIIPLLQILFGVSDESFSLVNSSEITSYDSALDAAKNNVLYFLQEQITTHGTIWVLFAIGAFVLTMSLLFNVISYFAYWVRIPIRTGISKELRKDAYNKILQIPVLSFSKENRGDFVSRMTSDIEEIEYGIGTTLDMLIKDPVQIIVYITTLVGLSAVLTGYAMSMLVAVVVIVLLIGKWMKKISHKAQSQRGQVLSFFEQTLGALHIIKAYNVTDGFRSRFASLNGSITNTFNRQNRFYSLAWPCTDFLIVLIIVCMMCVGGNLILTGKSSIGPATFIGFLCVFYSLNAPMRDLMKCTFGIRKAIASVERLNKVLHINDEQLTTESPNNNIALNLDLSRPLWELQNISFAYGVSPLWKDLNLQIFPNQHTLIVGNVGSGKSSLACLLIRFFEPASGKILFYGQDVKDIDKTYIREQVSYASQTPILLNDSIFNNIVFGDDSFTMDDVIEVSKNVHIHDFIMSLPDKYDTIIGDRGSLLSGGQKQCISLARALIRKKPILIMDEVTSSLDKELMRNVYEFIHNSPDIKSIIEIAHHDLSESNADRCIDLSCL